MDFAIARQKAIDAGIPENEITPAILKQFGWVPSDPLEGFTPAPPVQSKEELTTHLSALKDEMRANAMPEQIIDKVLSLGSHLMEFI